MFPKNSIFANLPENPAKIEIFKESTKYLDWSNEEKKHPFEILFSGVEALATKELNYYYRRRKTRSGISTITRLLAWAAGGVGIVFPLIAAANPHARSLTGWGYVFVVIGASVLGADTLFGGTSGHANFVIAQLKIENIIIRRRISWENLLANISLSGIFANPSKEQTDALFAHILEYVAEYYSITSSETIQWQKYLIEGIKSIQSDLSKK